MNYLQDYLRVVPKVEKERVEALLRANKAIYEVQNLTEREFQELVNFLAEKQEPVSKPIELQETMEAEDFNLFFSNVAIDLMHLFEEQNLLEGAAANYDRIFSGVLDDIRKEVAALRQREQELYLENKGEDGLFVRTYSFESENKTKHAEAYNADTKYLFEDRDGSVLPEVAYERSYHQHYISLAKEDELNVLVNDKNQTTARIKVTYENEGAVNLKEEKYKIDKAIDGSDDTYYMHVVLTTSPAIHKIPKHPDLDKLK